MRKEMKKKTNNQKQNRKKEMYINTGVFEDYNKSIISRKKMEKKKRN